MSRAVPDARAAAVAAVEEWLAAGADVDAERLEGDAWLIPLSGEHKQTIAVHLSVGERETIVQSFFVRAPDENAGGLYDYLLRRNLRSYVLRFAVTDERDVLLVGVLPNRAVDVAVLDHVLGQLLATADDAFDMALRLGFAAYIEREQAWRERVGAPRNPIS